MGWNLASIPLDASGVGNVNIGLNDGSHTQLILKVAIPIQPGLTSGTSDIVINDVLPSGVAIGDPLLTLTNVTLPYKETVQDTPVSPTNVAQSNYVYQGVHGINVSVVQGVAGGTANVWILLSD